MYYVSFQVCTGVSNSRKSKPDLFSYMEKNSNQNFIKENYLAKMQDSNQVNIL